MAHKKLEKMERKDKHRLSKTKQILLFFVLLIGLTSMGVLLTWLSLLI